MERSLRTYLLKKKKKNHLNTKQTYSRQPSMKQRTVFKETHDYESEITEIKKHIQSWGIAWSIKG